MLAGWLRCSGLLPVEGGIEQNPTRLRKFAALPFIPAAGVFAVKDGKETLLRDGAVDDHGDA
jgi:hypothetical protein